VAPDPAAPDGERLVVGEPADGLSPEVRAALAARWRQVEAAIAGRFAAALPLLVREEAPGAAGDALRLAGRVLPGVRLLADEEVAAAGLRGPELSRYLQDQVNRVKTPAATTAPAQTASRLIHARRSTANPSFS
jgi:hypothetical protein